MASIETALGSLKDIPSALLGWFCLAAIAAFLLYVQTHTQMLKMEELVQGQKAQIHAMERLTAKIEYFERVRLDLGK